VLPPEPAWFAEFAAWDTGVTMATHAVTPYSAEALDGRLPPTWAAFCALLPEVRATRAMPDGSDPHEIFRYAIRGELV
jgi:hypothetical protein